MNKWLKRTHEWFLPRCCVLCSGDTHTVDLCRWCLSALPRIAHGCGGCGVPIASGRLCARCLHRPPQFDRVCIPYRYESPLSSLVLGLKFQRRIEAAPPLAGILLESLRALPPPLPEVIVPVPLHPARIRQRGFNQALELSRPLARGLGLPLVPRLLKRVRNTAAQSSLHGPAERRRNVRRAFAVDPEGSARITHAALVDDVITTGATATEIARVLRNAGISRLELWGVARAALD